MTVSSQARQKEIIAALRLQPHPEGGLFAELYRDSNWVQHPTKAAMRPAMTLIYFLLPATTFSALHRVAQPEAWHHLEGDPLDLHLLTDEGTHEILRLGKDLAKGERPQRVVPPNAWQAAVPASGGAAGFSLVGCTVAPGFDFADFEMPKREVLLERFPQHHDLVLRLTHDGDPPSS